MQKSNRAYLPSAAATAFLALLFIICLSEGASGSCLSYGHSCWGAHGKRSGKPPASAPDWFITKMLRQIAANNDLNQGKHFETKKDDSDDIFRVVVDDTPADVHRLERESEEGAVDFASKLPEAKPMLDDDILSKMKLWQIMRVASQNQ
ncbi:unnamed protein product [Leptosia nina]|uniref:Uncharacterized protein n=1 Tax=Leptosia nina TaxID=320188 RepID=A0AAV1J603_9NEOP